MKKIVLFIACGLLIGNVAFAQATKFGYIDSRELLKAMPELATADKELQDFAKTYQDELQKMSKDYESKVAAFQAGEKTMSDAVKEVKVKEIQDLQNRMETYNQSATEKVDKKKQELYDPILKKADAAIKDVAKEKGYDYVFDASSGALLHAKETDNLLQLVKTKLGIK